MRSGQTRMRTETKTRTRTRTWMMGLAVSYIRLLGRLSRPSKTREKFLPAVLDKAVFGIASGKKCETVAKASYGTDYGTENIHKT